jgi:hypothetical protein
LHSDHRILPLHIKYQNAKNKNTDQKAKRGKHFAQEAREKL